MITIGIECAATCPACSARVPVNALVPTFYCPSCAGVIRLSPNGIAELVKEALSRPGQLRHNEGRRDDVWTPDGQFDLGYLRMDPRCEYCTAGLSAEEAVRAGAQAGWVQCSSCSAGISVRAAPPELAPALPNVSHLVGEDFSQLAAAGATSLVSSQQAQAVPCSQCGGALSVDGSSRQVACGYCGATVIVPDDVWARLHPTSAVRRWFAVVAGGAQPIAAASAAGAPIDRDSWPSPTDVCADAGGAVFCVGDDAVWALDPRQMRVRWMQHSHGLDVPKIAVTPDGRVIAWSDKADTARVYASADGRPLGELGGQEPPGAELHHLDFFKMGRFACDVDGSFLCLFEERLLRFSPQGVGVPTWPESGGVLSFLKGKQKQAPLWRPSPSRPKDRVDQNNWDPARQRVAVSARNAFGFDWMNFKLESVGSRPLAFGWNCRPRIGVGYDGCLYVLGEADMGSDMVLARFDREGKRIYSVGLPVDDLEWNTRPYASQNGTAFVLAKQNHEYRMLLRVSPDGREVAPIVTDRQMGGPLVDDDEHLALMPDGTSFVLGDGGWLKVFAADGRVLAMSAAARRGPD